MQPVSAPTVAAASRRGVELGEAGAVLGQERESNGLSVEQVAGRAGVPVALLWAIESGDALPSVDELAALLDVCGLRLDRNAAGELSYVTAGA